MTQITASQVKELRDKSGAGMMDAKKALQESGGDLEAALDWLRTKGLATAQKKSGRAAAEGLVAVVSQGNVGAVVEVNAETDFVARNEQFQDFVKHVADAALEQKGNLEDLLKAGYAGDTDKTVQEELTNLIATIGENMTVRRAEALSVENGVVATYMHSAAAPNMGKIGVIVALESTGDVDSLNALGKQVAMHIAASAPVALNKEDLDPTLVEREKAVLSEQARESGKPEEIIGKMVEGRIRKFYEEVVLMEQSFVMDTDSKVGDIIEKSAAEVGAPVKLKSFVRYTLGEGVEKKEDDFAEEVKKMAS